MWLRNSGNGRRPRTITLRLWAIYIEFNDRPAQANTYQQLGMVAEEQRQSAQAEDYYRKALEINIEFNDRHAQARTYGQLGNMAKKRQQWTEAENYYLQALAIFAEYRDEYLMGMTLRNLARLWQTGTAPGLPQRVAEVLGVSAEDIAAGFAKLAEQAPDVGE